MHLPHYKETPLIEIPVVATELSVGKVFVKDESSRFGLPSFKILGASWAVYYELCKRYKCDISSTTLEELGQLASGSVVLYTATDGNHGRAVARAAKLLGLEASIFVPNSVPSTARELIQAEGPHVHLTVIDGDYDTSVKLAALASLADCQRSLLVQDTSWPNYVEIPTQIVNGYTT